MLLLLATLLIGSYRPTAYPPIDQISTRRAIFGSRLDAGETKPADQLTCRLNPILCGCPPTGCSL